MAAYIIWNNKNRGTIKVTKKHVFNFWAFLFGILYFIYKRVWVGVIVYLIAIATSFLFSPDTQVAIDLILWVLAGFTYPILEELQLKREGFTPIKEIEADDANKALILFTKMDS